MSTKNFAVGQDLGGENAQLLIFMYLDFIGEPMFCHTGMGYVTWGGEDWLGVGRLAYIRSLRESVVLRPSAFQVGINGLPPELMYDVLNEATWGRLVEMYVGAWRDDDGGFVGDRDPDMFFRGRMGPPEVQIGRSSVVSVSIEDIRASLDRTNGKRATLLEHQEEEASGDTFYDLLPAMVDHTFVFNGKDHRDRASGTPGGEEDWRRDFYLMQRGMRPL